MIKRKFTGNKSPRESACCPRMSEAAQQGGIRSADSLGIHLSYHVGLIFLLHNYNGIMINTYRSIHCIHLRYVNWLAFLSKGEGFGVAQYCQCIFACDSIQFSSSGGGKWWGPSSPSSGCLSKITNLFPPHTGRDWWKWHQCREMGRIYGPYNDPISTIIIPALWGTVTAGA